MSAPVAQFTKYEQRVFNLMGEGLTNTEIAERLFNSVKTVEAHINHMCNKRNCTTRQLRYLAIEQDVLKRYGLVTA